MILWRILCWLYGIDFAEFGGEQMQTGVEASEQKRSEGKNWTRLDTFRVRRNTLYWLRKGPPPKYEIWFTIEDAKWGLVTWECEECHEVDLWRIWLKDGYVEIPPRCPRCGSTNIRMTVEKDPWKSEELEGGDLIN
jgi:hypothetical protein